MLQKFFAPLFFCVTLGFVEAKAQTRPDVTFEFCEAETKCGRMDEFGNVYIPPMYDYVGEFSDKVAIVISGELWGAVNDTGEVVIPIEFEHIRPFANGASRAIQNEQYGLIGLGGRPILPFQPRELLHFGEQQLVAIKDEDQNTWRFADISGQVIDGEAYDELGKYSRYEFIFDRLLVAREDKFGLVSSSGEQVFAPIYDSLVIAKAGVVIVEQDAQFALFDLDGNALTTFDFEVIVDGGGHGGDQDRLPFIQDGKIGYLDPGGNIVIEPRFDFILEWNSNLGTRVVFEQHRFHDGLAKFHKGSRGLVGYMDREGVVQIPAKFRQGTAFRTGLASVKRGRNLFYINTDGDKVFDVEMNGAAEIRLDLFQEGGFARISRITEQGNELTSHVSADGVEYAGLYRMLPRTNGLAIFRENGAYGVKRLVDGAFETLIPAVLQSVTSPLDASIVLVKFGDRKYALDPDGNPVGFALEDIAPERARWCALQTREIDWCAEH